MTSLQGGNYMQKLAQNECIKTGGVHDESAFSFGDYCMCGLAKYNPSMRSCSNDKELLWKF